MKYLIVMFTSRTDTMRFYSIIKNFNGFCSIVNTPHSLSRSCGISVKIAYNQFPIAQNLISRKSFSSFKGIFEVNTTNTNDIPKRIF